jgi:hypothetical protein
VLAAVLVGFKRDALATACVAAMRTDAHAAAGRVLTGYSRVLTGCSIVRKGYSQGTAYPATHAALLRVVVAVSVGRMGTHAGYLWAVRRTVRYVATSGRGRATRCRAVCGAPRRTVAVRSISGR